MKKSTLLLSNIRLKPSQIHKLRGFVGNLFKDYDVIHNHDPVTGKPIYRYPLIQFKLLRGTPVIIAITDKAVEAFAAIFMTLEKIRIGETEIPVYEKDLKLEEVSFGYSAETFMYEFASPWIGLNQASYRQYSGITDHAERNLMLKRKLIGNILSMSKYLDYWVEKGQEIRAEIRMKERPVNLKGRSMIGFAGMFKTNFVIPDDLGIGKSVSRGFGTVKKKI
ncbi:CRISPR-associated endonuclease Cas6 [Desulfobacterales bacterium HSG2]|nr:CRISPR-associated endonuclease Cas6 [Desulfobacterales bacterium HSG2]